MFMFHPTQEALDRHKALIAQLDRSIRAADQEWREEQARRVAQAMEEIAEKRRTRIAASRAIDPR